MMNDQHMIADPRMRAAVAELQELILAHFPSTTFEVGEADYPDEVYMRAIVDVDDTDDVIAIFLDRLVGLQVDENLPIWVAPVRTPERIPAANHLEQKTRYRELSPGWDRRSVSHVSNQMPAR
jgi:hypothetical protein